MAVRFKFSQNTLNDKLHKAVQQYDKKTINQMIYDGANVNSVIDFTTPLSKAIERASEGDDVSKKFTIVKILLNAGSKFSKNETQKNSYDYTYINILLTSLCIDYPLFMKLMKAGLKVDLEDLEMYLSDSGTTCKPKVSIVKSLIKKLNLSGDSYNYALNVVARSKEYNDKNEILKELLKTGANPNKTVHVPGFLGPRSGTTSITIDVLKKNGNKKIIDLIMKKKKKKIAKKSDCNGLSVAQLKKMASDKKIKGRSKMNKEKLCIALGLKF